MKSSELRDLNDASLVQRLVETREELFNLRFQIATAQSDKSARLSELRRDVARIETLIREREIAAAEAVKENA
ncbi:MAG: 50S ribosomal protein L29 [Acidimicrobiia bacterium]